MDQHTLSACRAELATLFKEAGDDGMPKPVKGRVQKVLEAAGTKKLQRSIGKRFPELKKKAAPLLQRALSGLASEGGTHKAELAGLGMLAVPGLDQLQAHARAGLAGDYNKDGVKSREMLPHIAHPLIETAGLGVLAGPSAAHLLSHAGTGGAAHAVGQALKAAR